MPDGMGGCQYKTERIDALAREIRSGKIGKDKDAFDLMLLEELWEEEDHNHISAHLPRGYHMTGFRQLADHRCHNELLIKHCSGLAIISKFPFQNIQFNMYTERGSILDGEALAGKGIGRVRINPVSDLSVDVFVTHTIADSGKDWLYNNTRVRIDQIQELMNSYVVKSDADVVILGGDFNTAPSNNTNSPFEIVKLDGMADTEEVVIGESKWLKPKYATYANDRNPFSGHLYSPTIMDYLFYQTRANGVTVTPIDFKLPLLTTNVVNEANIINISNNKSPFFYVESKITSLKHYMMSETRIYTSMVRSVGDMMPAGKKEEVISLSDHEPIMTMMSIEKVSSHA